VYDGNHAQAAEGTPRRPRTGDGEPDESSSAQPDANGTAATDVFSIGLEDTPGQFHCPCGITKTRRADDPDEMENVCVRCKTPSKCGPCRAYTTRQKLLKAQDGIRADLAAGRVLAVHDGLGSSVQALRGHKQKTAGFLHCRLGERQIVVCACDSGAVPYGFAEAAPDAAAAKLREIEALVLAAAARPENGHRFQPVSLSRSWSRAVGAQFTSPTPSPVMGKPNCARSPRPRYETVAEHRGNDLHAFTEVLRRFGLDPALDLPKRPGRVLWRLRFNVAGLDESQRRELIKALDAIPRESAGPAPPSGAPSG